MEIETQFDDLQDTETQYLLKMAQRQHVEC